MTDLSFSTDMVPHAQVVAHHAKHVVHHVAPVIKQGYSMLSLLLSSVASLAAGFGLGWYIKGRGMTGVKIDLNNVKSDVEKIKAQVFPAVAAA